MPPQFTGRSQKIGAWQFQLRPSQIQLQSNFNPTPMQLQSNSNTTQPRTNTDPTETQQRTNKEQRRLFQKRLSKRFMRRLESSQRTLYVQKLSRQTKLVLPKKLELLKKWSRQKIGVTQKN